MLLISGCGELRIGRWFEGVPPVTQPEATADGGTSRRAATIRRALDDDAPYPNLADVPPRPTDVPSGVELSQRKAQLEKVQTRAAVVAGQLDRRAETVRGAAVPIPAAVVADGVPPPVPDLSGLTSPLAPRRISLTSAADLIPDSPIPAISDRQTRVGTSLLLPVRKPPKQPASLPPAAPVPVALPGSLDPATTAVASLSAQAGSGSGTKVDELPRPIKKAGEAARGTGLVIGPPQFSTDTPTLAEGVNPGYASLPPPPTVPLPVALPGSGAIALAETLPPRPPRPGAQTGPRPVAEFRRADGMNTTERTAVLNYPPTTPSAADAQNQLIGRIALAQPRLGALVRVFVVEPGGAAGINGALARERARQIAQQMIAAGAEPAAIFLGVAEPEDRRPAVPGKGGERVEIYLDY